MNRQHTGWAHLADSLGWSPGHTGKGYLLANGSIRTWNLDVYNPESHREHWERQHEISPSALNFEIDPDGGVITTEKTTKVDTIVNADPRLYDAGQRPEFEDSFALENWNPTPKPNGKPDYNYVMSSEAMLPIRMTDGCPRCHSRNIDEEVGQCLTCGYTIPYDGHEIMDGHDELGPVPGHGATGWGTALDPDDFPRDELGPPHYGKPNYNYVMSGTWHPHEHDSEPWNYPAGIPGIQYGGNCPACSTPLKWQQRVQAPDDGLPRNDFGQVIGVPGASSYPVQECPNCQWPHRALRRPNEGVMPEPAWDSLDVPALGPRHYGMALRPEDAQSYIDQHGPYLEHWTRPENVPGILRTGIQPGTHPASDSEFEEDPEYWDDQYEPFTPDQGHIRRNWDGFIETRPGYTYLAAPGVIKPGENKNHLQQDPYQVPVRVDLRKLDPQNLEADEDAARTHWPEWKEIARDRIREQEGREPEDYEPDWMLDPPDARLYEPDDYGSGYGLGTWAEDMGMSNPEWTADSLMHPNTGSIAHRGVIPPSAISLHPDYMDQYPPEAGGLAGGQMSLFSAKSHIGGWQEDPDPDDYRGVHTAPGPSGNPEDLSSGWPITDMSANAPGFYEKPRRYMYNDRRYDHESLRAVLPARDNPDAMITIHRAAPEGQINSGDWVTPSLSYAQHHALHPTDPTQDGPVWSAQVPASTLWWGGDDLNEYGYHGPPISPQRTSATRRIAGVPVRYHPTIDPERLLVDGYLGYAGRWPTIWDGKTLHVGPEGSTHAQVLKAGLGSVGGIRDDGPFYRSGWVGHNPEAYEGRYEGADDREEFEDNGLPYGWYGNPSQKDVPPAVTQAMLDHHRMFMSSPQLDSDAGQGYGHAQRVMGSISPLPDTHMIAPAIELREWLADFGAADPSPSIHHADESDFVEAPASTTRELPYFPPANVPKEYKQGSSDGYEPFTFPTGKQMEVNHDQQMIREPGDPDSAESFDDFLYQSMDYRHNPSDFVTPLDPHEEFWRAPYMVYHGTPAENVEDIRRNGLQPRNLTRGIQNRNISGAVFTSPEPSTPAYHYGPNVFAIDAPAMKRDGYTPQVGTDGFDDSNHKEAIAHALGMEDYEHSAYGGEDPSTVVFHEAIPPKYLRLLDESEHSKVSGWQDEPEPAPLGRCVDCGEPIVDNDDPKRTYYPDNFPPYMCSNRECGRLYMPSELEVLDKLPKRTKPPSGPGLNALTGEPLNGEPVGGWDTWGGEPTWDNAERCAFCGSPNTGTKVITPSDGRPSWLKGQCRDCMAGWEVNQDQARTQGETDPTWDQFWRGSSKTAAPDRGSVDINAGWRSPFEGPATYDPAQGDPHGLAPLKDLVQKLDTQWAAPLAREGGYSSAEEVLQEWERYQDENPSGAQRIREAVANVIVGACLSPKTSLEQNAQQYQDILKHKVPWDCTDPNVYWDALEDARQEWNTERGHADDVHRPWNVAEKRAINDPDRPGKKKYLQTPPRYKLFVKHLMAAEPDLDKATAEHEARRMIWEWKTQIEDRLKELNEGNPEPSSNRITDNVSNKAVMTILQRTLTGEQPEQVFQEVMQQVAAKRPPVHQFGDEYAGFANDKMFNQYKYGAFMGTNIQAICQLKRHLEDLIKAALVDVHIHDGAGHTFRAQVLSYNVSGIGPKLASFMWLLLQPLTSQLGTIDTHMAKVLGHKVEGDEGLPNRDFFQAERELRSYRDLMGMSDVPLGQFQWLIWDLQRSGNAQTGLPLHQDHEGLRVLDPPDAAYTPWLPKLVRPPMSPVFGDLRDQVQQVTNDYRQHVLGEDPTKGSNQRLLWAKDAIPTQMTWPI